MNKLFLIFLIFSATTYAAKIGDGVLKLGSEGHEIKAISGGKLQFSNDGLIFKNLGSGSGSGSGGGINLLTNSSAEESLTGWTTSGGTLTVEDYTYPKEGDLKHFRFVATAAGQYVEQTYTQFPNRMGKGCMADFWYNQGDDAFTYEIVETGESSLVSDILLWEKAPSLKSDCVATGSPVTIRITSTGAGTIDFDNAYLGSDRDISDITAIREQMSSYTYSSKASDNTIRFTEGLSGVSDIGSGIFTYSDDSASGTLLTFQKPADITLTVRLGNSSTQGFWVQLNGNNLTAETTSQSSPVDTGSGSVRVLVNSGDILRVWGSVSVFNQGSMIIVAKTRLTKLSAIDPETASFYINGSIGGAQVPITSSSSPTIPQHNGLDLVMNYGSAMIACNNGPSSGATCSGVNEALGLTTSYPRSATYKICYTFSNNSLGSTAFRIVETEASTNTVLQTSEEVINPSSSDQTGNRLCTRFKFTTGVHTFKLAYEANNTGNIYADRSTSFYQRDVNISVEMVSHDVSRSVINNMVDTSYKLGKRIESCYIDASGGTPTSGSPLCSEWISSYIDDGVGEWVVNIQSGIFNTAPICIATYNTGNGSSGFDRNCQVLQNSSTSFDLSCRQNNALADARVTFICTGGR
jgi:hypothetical protein